MELSFFEWYGKLYKGENVHYCMSSLLKVKRKDPICETTQKKGKGREKHGEWFCSKHCIKEYEKKLLHKKNQLNTEL